MELGASYVRTSERNFSLLCRIFIRNLFARNGRPAATRRDAFRAARDIPRTRGTIKSKLWTRRGSPRGRILSATTRKLCRGGAYRSQPRAVFLNSPCFPSRIHNRIFCSISDINDRALRARLLVTRATDEREIFRSRAFEATCIRYKLR